ncbi:MAG: hypothetical protein KA243_02255 [Candidatus Aminicenantes bacterium]|nr:hypothetical protein [Candidatus Aminicenantes bacterium]
MRCAATRKDDGKPCTCFAVAGKSLCIWHLPYEERRPIRAAHQEREVDPVATLKGELRRVKKLAPSAERARLILEILRLLRDYEGKPEPAEKEPQTPAEKVAAIRKPK